MKIIKRYAVPTIVTCVFLYLLFQYLGEVDYKDIFKNLDPFYFFLSFIFYLVAAVLRLIRINMAYPDYNLPVAKLFSLSAIHTFLSNILPSRVGEVSFVYLMKRIFDQRFSKNTFALIFLRLLDLLVVVSFFMLSALVVGFKSLRGGNFFLVFLLTLLLGFFSFYLVRFVEIFGRLTKFLLKLFHQEKRTYAARILTIFKALSGISLINNFKMYFASVVLSIGVWIFLFLSGYFLTLSLGFGLGWGLFIFGVTSSTLTSLIPISSFGAFGTYELGWIGAYSLAGLGRDQAILAGLSLHIVSLLFSLLLALVGLIMIYFTIFRNRRVWGK